MFDLALLRVPTFNGGLIAAWAVSASVISLLTYLIIYFQGMLGYSALQTGLRVLPLSVAGFVASVVAGRLSDAVAARWLIAPGFVLVGVGVLLMGGVSPGDDWTHFLAGFIIAGFGTGLINVPLASTAVGVVHHSRAGMAAGMNTTFRQLGIATGVAALGNIFATTVADTVRTSLADGPLAGRATELADAAATGGAASAIEGVAAAQQGLAAGVLAQSFADGLNAVLLVGAVVAFTAALAVAVLVRPQDIVHAQDNEVLTPDPVPTSA